MVQVFSFQFRGPSERPLVIRRQYDDLSPVQKPVSSGIYLLDIDFLLCSVTSRLLTHPKGRYPRCFHGAISATGCGRRICRWRRSR